jgi:hypothetical protein
MRKYLDTQVAGQNAVESEFHANLDADTDEEDAHASGH